MPQTLGSLPIGAKVKFEQFRGVYLKWLVKGKNHQGFPAGAVTLVTERIIKLMAVDASEANNSDPGRQHYGSNRYTHSNIRQWLNSENGPGQWYSPAHPLDAPPMPDNVFPLNANPYNNIAGFMYEFTPNSKAVILDTTLTVKKSVFDGGGTETCVDKIFLLSLSEIADTYDDFTEGLALEGFSDDDSRVAMPDTGCLADNNCEDDFGLNVNSGWCWWLRSLLENTSYRTFLIDENGDVIDECSSCGLVGVRPACNLPSSILVSDVVDGDGYYNVICNELPLAPAVIDVPATVYGTLTADIAWGAAMDPDGFIAGYLLERRYDNGAWAVIYTGLNLCYGDLVSNDHNLIQYRVRAVDDGGEYSPYVTSPIRYINHNPPPVVSLNDGDLGVFSGTAPEVTFTISETNSQIVNINVKLDGVSVLQQAGDLNGDNVVTLPPEVWVKVLNGDHVLTVGVIDSYGNEITRTLTFQKVVGKIIFTFQTPLEADDRPNVIVASVAGSMPDGSELIVEACNNGFDDEPEWENITPQVATHNKYFFQNQTKEADAWGVNLRVTLKRGTAIEPVYITSVGGNFA